MLNLLIKIKDKITLYIEDYIEQQYLWKKYGKNNKKTNSQTISSTQKICCNG